MREMNGRTSNAPVATGNYEFVDGKILLNAAGNMPSIMGLNEPLVNTAMGSQSQKAEW